METFFVFVTLFCPVLLAVLFLQKRIVFAKKVPSGSQVFGDKYRWHSLQTLVILNVLAPISQALAPQKVIASPETFWLLWAALAAGSLLVGAAALFKRTR